VDLAVRTPMRLVREKKLQRAFHWEAFQSSLLRRARGMSETWAPEWAEPSIPLAPPRFESNLSFHEWRRHSTHQDQDIELGGLQGYLRLIGNLEPWRPWLDTARILGVGKNAAFGLGHLEALLPLKGASRD
jgi:hypothetical protein